MEQFRQMLQSARLAWQDPRAFGDGLRMEYWLTRADMLTALALLSLFGLFQDLMDPHGYPEPVMVYVALDVIFGAAVYWWLIPLSDKIGFWLLGVRLSYRQAREVMVATWFPIFYWPGLVMALIGLALMPYMAPLAMLILFGWAVVIIVKAVKITMHLLGISASKAFFGPAIGPAIVVLLSILVGISIGYHKAHANGGSQPMPASISTEQK